jgi:type IV secretory pathway VirB3-like protein
MFFYIVRVGILIRVQNIMKKRHMWLSRRTRRRNKRFWSTKFVLLPLTSKMSFSVKSLHVHKGHTPSDPF